MKKNRDSKTQPRRFWSLADVDRAFARFAAFAGDVRYDGSILADGTFLLSWSGREFITGAWRAGGFLIRTSDFDRYQAAVCQAKAVLQARKKKPAQRVENISTAKRSLIS